MDGLERLNYAWQKADTEARISFARDILNQQGMRGESEIAMTSQVNATDGSPAVLLKWGEHICVLSSATAKRHGAAVIETAMAADTDAFLFNWLITVVKSEPHRAGQLLIDFRKWRDEHAQSQALDASPEGREES